MSSFVCTNCESVGMPRRITPGSIWIELLLWGLGLVTVIFVIGVFILLGALGYSIWRISARYSACPFCGHRNMVLKDSPAGRRIIERYTPTKP